MAREKAPLPTPGPAADKQKALSTAMAQIERAYGKGAIMRFGDKAEQMAARAAIEERRA